MMRRGTPITLEILERKLLLSGASSSLAASLVATPTTTSSGTTVSLRLTETNVSNQTVHVTTGPSNDGFVAVQNGKPVWVSNSGIEPMFLQLKTLSPGQSFTINGTWDGHSSGASPVSSSKGPALNGTFTITNELDPSETATVTLGAKATPIAPKWALHWVV